MESLLLPISGPSCRLAAMAGASRSPTSPSLERASTSGSCHPSHQSSNLSSLHRTLVTSPSIITSSTSSPKRTPYSAGKIIAQLIAPVQLCSSSFLGEGASRLQAMPDRVGRRRGGALTTTSAMQMTRLRPPDEPMASVQKKLGYPTHVKFAIDEICELAPRASLAKAMANLQVCGTFCCSWLSSFPAHHLKFSEGLQLQWKPGLESVWSHLRHSDCKTFRCDESGASLRFRLSSFSVRC